MKIILFTLIFLFFSFSVNPEIFYCQYQDENEIKNFKFDRTGHSHFKRCQDNVCDNKGLSIIHVDNKNLIFGDIFQNKNSEKFIRIYLKLIHSRLSRKLAKWLLAISRVINT